MVQFGGVLIKSTLAKMAHDHRRLEAMVIIKEKIKPSLREALDISTSEQLCLGTICSITAFTIFENEGSHDRP